MVPRNVARKASSNPTQIRTLRDLLSLPPDGYSGLIEEYRRLRLDVQERHEAQLYLGMQTFRMWLIMSNMGSKKLEEDEVRATLGEVLSALESQDHNGYQRLRSKMKAYAGPNSIEEMAPMEFYVPRLLEIEVPRFQKGDEVPKAEDILVGILYDFVVLPLVKELEGEEWQAQSLKESMAMKAALWAATESNTTKISREKKEKAAVGQLALWAVALLMLAGMGFVGWKMGFFFGKNVDPAVAMNQARAAMKSSDFASAIVHGELALELLKERQSSKKDTAPVREFLVEAYIRGGRRDQARELLVQLKNDFPKEKRYVKRLKDLEAKPKPKPKKK